MISTILVVALFLHGLAHALFVANALGYRRATTDHGQFSMLDMHAAPAAGNLLGLLWLLPLLGFVAGAWGLANGLFGWQSLLLASALVSSSLIWLRWKSVNASYALFALAFNVFVVALVYWNSQGGIFAG